MWSPAMPTMTDWILIPERDSASATALWMERTVLSMFVTTPRVSPSEGLRPTPSTLKRPPSSAEATTLQTFVVPISSPTIISLSILVSLPSIPLRWIVRFASQRNLRSRFIRLLDPLCNDLVIKPEVDRLQFLGPLHFHNVLPECLKEIELSQRIAAAEDDRGARIDRIKRDVTSVVHI